MMTMTRRSFFCRVGQLGLGAVVAAGSARADEPRKLKVVVTGGHPGDPEYGCGGTVARMTDGDAIVDRSHYESFRKQLQSERPDAVLTHWPIDNHADHRAMSMLVYDAWLQSRKGFALYYYEVSNGEDTVQFSPTDYVDISDVEPRKRRACHAHASQAPDRFYATQDQVARFRGIERGFRRAEGFIRHVQSRQITLPTAS